MDAAYGLSKAISCDLKRKDIDFQADSVVHDVGQKLGSDGTAAFEELR